MKQTTAEKVSIRMLKISAEIDDSIARILTREHSTSAAVSIER